MRVRPSPADYLSALRLLALPILWALALSQKPVALGIGLGLAGFTDVLDGPVARRNSAKAAGVVGHVFAIWLFIFEDYSPVLWALTIGLAILAASETLLAALLRRPDEGWRGTVLTRLL